MDPLPASTLPAGTGRFTTIVQTMGVCSTADPSATPVHMARLADLREGRILLLKHGKGYYGWVNWMLDKAAAQHADGHGCWFNRAVGRVLEDSGLVVD